MTRLLLFMISCSAATFGAEPAFRMSLPGQPWAVEFPIEGFKVDFNGNKPDGRRYFRASNQASGLIVSITLEHVEGRARLKDCRRSLSEQLKSPFQKTDIRRAETEQMISVEYMVAEHNGVPTRQKNVLACMANGDAYIDIHLSKVQFEPRDQELFTSALKAVRVTDLGLGAFEYMAAGSRAYLNREYKQAIFGYRKALELEKQQRTLTADYWRALVDNLGMAYGISGNLNLAEEVFQYGIAQDPAYPMFYYNMGCVSAGRNDLGGTLKYLKLTLTYKQNMIQGEKLPDPSKDDSFKAFVSDPEFKKIAQEFK